MSETFSVKAILSADDGSFRSVFNNATGVLSSFSNATSGLTGGLSGIMNTVKGGLGFGILQGIGQKAFSVVSSAVSGLTSNLGNAISRYDTLAQFPKTMELMGFKTEETKAATDKLVDAIDGLPTSLDGITANAQNIALVTGNLDKATDTTIALNNAFLMSGSSTAEAERGLTQYVQMLSSGKVDMASWQTLLDTMSPALNKVAESFGYTGERAKLDLYDALKSGEITFDDFNNRLIEMNNGMEISGEEFKGFAELARASSTGIQTSMENVKTAVVKNLANMITELDNRLRESGESIAGYFDKIKSVVNNTFKTFIESSVFQSLVTSVQNTVSAMESAFKKFTESSAMKAVHDNLDRVAKNLGEILPNVIRNLEPIIESVAKVATGVIGAISDVIAKVTGSKAFMTFCENIGKAIEKIGGVVEKIISQLDKYFVAILGAANEVIDAFGKAFDAITNSATATGTATKLYDNFQKVLGFAKDALIKVAGFLEKHHSWILKIIEHLPQIVALVLSVKGALLVLEKVKTFMTLIDQVKNFGKSINNAVTDVGSFASKIINIFKNGASGAKDAMSDMEYSINGNFTNIDASAGVMGQSVTTKVGGAFSTLTSKIGGALGNVASKVGSVISSVASVAGPIAAVAGPVVAAVMGIVTAIQKWKEEQYKAGQALHEMSEEESQFIDSAKQTCQAYDDLREAATNSYASKESDVRMTELLRDKYLELFDANGNVIAGKEELAEKLAGEMCESLGLEKSKVEELRGEYQNLITANGDVKEGYEERADEILGELAQAWGLEKNEVEEIIGKNKDLIGIVNDVSEAKRESAKVEAINEAYKQSIQDAIKLETDHKTALELKQKAEEELASFLVENGDNYAKYSDKQRGEYDKIIEKIDKYDTALEENEVAQKNNLSVSEIAGDARVAAAEGDAEALELCWARLTEGLKDHTSATQEELRQQLLDAKNYLNERKTAYEESGSEEDRIEYERAQAKKDWVAKEYEALLSNTDGYLTKDLEAKKAAAQKELDAAQAHLDEIQKRNATAAETRFKESTKAAEDEVAQKKAALDTIEQDLAASLLTQETLTSTHYDNINSTQQEKLEEGNRNNNDKLDQRNKDTDAKLSELTHIYPKNLKAANDAGLAEQKDGTQKATAEAKNTVDNVNTELSALAGVAEVATGNAKTAVMNNMQQTNVEATKEAQATRNNINAATAGLPKDLANVFSTTKSGVISETTDLKNKAVSNSQETARGMVDGYSNLGSGISSKAANAMSMTQQALIAGQTTLTFAVVGMVNALISQFSALGDRMASIGKNAIVGLNNGLCSYASMVYNTAAAIANNVANTIASALQIHSPSKLTTQYGKYVVQGLIDGMEATKSALSKSASGVAGTLGSALADELKWDISDTAAYNADLLFDRKYKAYEEKQKKSLKEYTDKQNKTLNEYIKNQYSARDKYVAQQKSNAQKYLAQWYEYQNQLGGKLTATQYNSIVNKMNTLKDKIDQSNKNIEEKYKTTDANIAAQTKKTKENIAAQTKKVNDSISDNYKKYDAEWNNILSDDTLSEQYVTAAKKRVEQLKKSNKLNAAQEVDFWKYFVGVCKKGTEAYNEAVAKLSEAKTTLTDDVSKVTKNYVSNITKAFDELEKSISSRADSIVGAFKLYDRVSFSEGTTKDALISNLDSQVRALSEYDAVMDSLEKRLGYNSELYKELQKQDISSLYNLKQISSMSDKELKQYANLYNQKVNLARERAEKDNHALEDQVKSQVSALTTTYEKELTSLGAAMAVSGGDIGKMFVSGIKTGLSEGKSGLDSYLQSMATSMVNAVKDKLQIHSPSRVSTWIGEMFGKGLVNGLEEYQSKADRAAEGLLKITDDRIREVGNLIQFPDIGRISDIPVQIASNNNFVKDDNYNYNGSFTATIEVPVNLNGREISRITVDTDSEEQYYKKKRYGR